MKYNIIFIGGTSAIGQSLRDYFPNAVFLSSKDYNVLNLQNYNTDVAVNLSGISQLNDLSEWNQKTIYTIQVNALGAVAILASFLPQMREKRFGRIIFMSSVCSVINLPGHGVYSATKAFVDKLVRIAAIENGKYGITVNSIQLGYTGIGMSENTPANMERQKQKSALGRFCQPEEIANTIKFIIDNEFVNGTNIRLDGGMR